MKKTLKVLAAFLVSGLCLWFAFKGVHVADLKGALKNVAGIWFLPAMGVYLVNQSFRCLRWKILLSPLKKISAPTLFPLLMMGFFLNIVLPVRAGEFARAIAAGRANEIPTSASFGSVAMERLTDFFGLFCVLLLASQALPANKLPIGIIFTILLCGFAIGGGALAFFQHKGSNWHHRFQGRGGKILQFLTNLTTGFLAIKSPRKMALVGLLSAAIWCNEAAIIFFVSRVMALNLSVLQAPALLVGLSVGYMIPAAPGYVGTVEFFGKQTLLFLGFPAASALSFILVLHTFGMSMTTLFGLPSLIYVGRHEKQRRILPTAPQP